MLIFLRSGIVVVLAFITIVSVSFSQELVINEVMTSNQSTLFDRDGDSPDWIEIYNPGSMPINLLGYGLADNMENEPWLFPDIEIDAGKHLLVFASDKNLTGSIIYWETIFDLGTDWKYLIPDSEPDPSWRNSGFDDSSWLTGKSGIGYGDGDDSTIVQNAGSVFMRKTFNVSDPSEIESMILHIDYDDSFVAFINGSEVVRRNISSTGPPAFNQFSNTDREAIMYNGAEPESFELSPGWLVTGENVLSIQVHNVSTGSSDLSAIPIFSIGLNTNNGNQISPYIQLSNRRLHTDFKIKSEGETLYLLSPTLVSVDSIGVPDLRGDISFGRNGDNGDSWVFFDQPTPELPNNTPGFEKFANEVILSTDGGLFSSSFELSMETDAFEDIYYTTDGSVPDETDFHYSVPITIGQSMTIRARALAPGTIPGKINTQSYFIGIDHTIPVISLVTEPDNLWDNLTGIYVEGPNAQTNFPFFGANFWQDWERPIHVELYTKEGELAISQDAGVKIFGGWSRGNNQKSLTIHARKSYGEDKFDYPIFETKELDDYKNFVLRNSGNDWGSSMFRDGFMTSLFHESVDRQAYQPAVVYINGVYWGLHNIREKINEHFINNNHGVDTENLSILELDGIPVYGDEEEYRNLIQFVGLNNLNDEGNYNYVKDRVDIMNYIYYQLGNIYIHNTDWPGNNIKFWKENSAEGKWRWIAFDTDFGFGIWDYNGKVSANTIEYALEASGPGWPNPPWSTLLFRKLMQNSEFRNLFINTMADEMNTTLLPKNVKPKIEAIVEEIEDEMPRHFSRWDGNMTSWNNNINDILRFADQRPQFVRLHIRNYFNISSEYNLELGVNSSAFGEIKLNTLQPEEYPWSGTYYSGIPVTLVAKPKPGYRFVRWEGDIALETDSISLAFNNNTSITAVFEPYSTVLGQVIINEINYNSSLDLDAGDWVEIYNRSDETIDISSWVLKDINEDNGFVFESGTVLAGNEFLVISRDLEKFAAVHPSVSVIGEMEFGLSSNGDCVRLFSNLGELSDIVCYENISPWPESANGQGSTLALEGPYLDNEDGSNWYGLSEGGNPGEPNDVVLGVKQNTPESRNIQLFPNPIINSTTIKFELKGRETVLVELLDLQGRNLATIENNSFSAGQHRLIWNVEALKSGIYLLKLNLGKESSVIRIIKN